VTFASKRNKAHLSFYPADGQQLLVTENKPKQRLFANIYSPADGHFKGKAALLKHKNL